MSELFTIKEVAAKFKVKEVTVRSWLTKGLIAAIKLPQGIRFREEHLEGWLNKRTIKAKS